MITAIKIQNFQSHEETTLDFSPGVNIIVGQTDSGKTSIIRAIRWLIWNRPSGSAIRSTWGGKTSVRLETDEAIILRSKGKTDKYSLRNVGQKPLVFKAFGASVPEEVRSSLNINEINLQQQHDNSFLLSKSAGEVAQHFNKVARLDKIDLSIQNINRWIRELEHTIKYKTDEIESKKEEIESFAYLDTFETEIEVLESLQIQFLNKFKREKKLRSVLTNIQEVTEEIALYDDLLEGEETVNKIYHLIDQKEDIGREGGKLLFLMKWIEESKKKIKKHRQLISIENLVESLLQLYKDINILKINKSSLSLLLNNINNTNGQVITVKANLIKMQAEFKRVFPNECPLCGKPK